MQRVEARDASTATGAHYDAAAGARRHPASQVQSVSRGGHGLGPPRYGATVGCTVGPWRIQATPLGLSKMSRLAREPAKTGRGLNSPDTRQSRSIHQDRIGSSARRYFRAAGGAVGAPCREDLDDGRDNAQTRHPGARVFPYPWGWPKKYQARPAPRPSENGLRQATPHPSALEVAWTWPRTVAAF